MGWSAAMLEMLVFSVPGLVKILPALPEKWKSGICNGVLCRGGIETSIQWDMEQKTLVVRMMSKFTQTITLKLPFSIRELKTKGNSSLSPKGDHYRIVHLIEGEETVIEVKG